MHSAALHSQKATTEKCRADWPKLVVWLGVLLLCFLFWFGAHSLARAGSIYNTPPEYDYPHPNVEITEHKHLLGVRVACARRMGYETVQAILKKGLHIHGCAPVRIDAETGKTRPVERCKIDVWVGADMEETIRHEIAHCNGWSHDLP